MQQAERRPGKKFLKKDRNCHHQQTRERTIRRCTENRKRLIPYPNNGRTSCVRLKWSAVFVPDGDVTYNEGMSLVDVPYLRSGEAGRRIAQPAS